MISRSNSIYWCFVLLVCLYYSANGFVTMSYIFEEKENTICFDVANVTSTSETSPKLGLILEVSYPQSVGEAGRVILEGSDMMPGSHAVSYQYRITNMTHDLGVWLDGKEKKLTKPDDPRWYFVSTFREVSVLLQGKVSICPCLNKTLNNQLVQSFETKNLSNTTDDSKNRFFIDNDADVSPYEISSLNLTQNLNSTLDEDDLLPQGETKDENLAVLQNMNALNSTINITSAVLEQSKLKTIKASELFTTTTTTTTTTTSTTSTKSTTTKPTSTTTSSKIATKDTKNVQAPIPDLEGNTYSINFPLLNYSDVDASRSESSQSCFSGSCEGPFGRDYALAYSLFGILGGMVLIAIVISVVFHRKKKKLMASNRARPKNRIRQEIYESERESQLMLKEMEPTYEEIP